MKMIYHHHWKVRPNWCKVKKFFGFVKLLKLLKNFKVQIGYEFNLPSLDKFVWISALHIHGFWYTGLSNVGV
jgi:hypothetical protein